MTKHNVKYCTECKFLFVNYEKFCKFCGKELITAGYKCPMCDTEVYQSHKFCDSCGTDLQGVDNLLENEVRSMKEETVKEMEKDC